MKINFPILICFLFLLEQAAYSGNNQCSITISHNITSGIPSPKKIINDIRAGRELNMILSTLKHYIGKEPNINIRPDSWSLYDETGSCHIGSSLAPISIETQNGYVLIILGKWDNRYYLIDPKRKINSWIKKYWFNICGA